jgi:hypothetical protein
MRILALTSPLMRGQDVVALQRALNAWNRETHNATLLAVDGQYGPETQSVTAIVAYRMGLGHTHALPAIQRCIENPRLRSPLDLRRATERRKAAIAAGTGLLGVLANAQSHIGVAEKPPGSNEGTPYPSKWEENFGMNGVSWCGCFAGSMILAAGGHVTSRVAYCPYIRQDAEAKVNGFDLWTPDHQDGVKPGWLVLYCWDSTGLPEHVGVVESIGGDSLVAVEGNTSGTNPSDGGMVARMTRPYEFVVGYARPRMP